MNFHKNFHRKNLIFLAASLCTVIFVGCSAKESTFTDDSILSETKQTECQPVSKSTDNTAVKVQTVDTPVIPKVVKVRNDIKKSTGDIPGKNIDNEKDKSNAPDSKISSDTDLKNKNSDIDTEKEISKTVSSEVKNDTDSKNNVSDINTEKDKQNTTSSNTDSDLSKNISSKQTEAKKDSNDDKIETKSATKTPPKKYQIKLKHFTQYKEMPTGCELVSARTILEYYGKNITYEHMLYYTPKANLKTTKDGKLYGKTPYQAFLGDPTKSSGFGCYPPVIMEMIANYNYNDLYAESTCNLPLDFIAKTYIPQDIPVLVWATIGMGDSYLTDSWYIEGEDGKPTGKKYTWRAAEHCLVLTGYDEKYYYFSDPLYYQDITKYEKPLAEKRYKEIGYNSMIIRKYE